MLVDLILLALPGCHPADPPEVAFDRAYRTYIHGDLLQSKDLAQKGYQRFSKSDPHWAARFQNLEAEILLFAGRSEEVLQTLEGPAPASSEDVLVDRLALQSAANARLHRFDQAEESLLKAEQLCRANLMPKCGAVIRARGFLVEQRGDEEKASKYFHDSLVFAREHNEKYLETSALLNLGLSAMHRRHFDEAIDWLNQTRESAAALQAGIAETKAVGDLGWVYYNLGDFDQSLETTLEAEKLAHTLNDGFDELAWEMDAGQVYAALGNTAQAKISFRQSLDQARKLNSKQDILDGLTVLAALETQTGDFANARHDSDEGLALARAAGNHPAELNLLLVQGTVAAQSHETEKAESLLTLVVRDPSANDSLKWASEYALARMYEEAGEFDQARSAYEKSLAEFEHGRSELSRDDLKLSFLTNASDIYESYVHFLVSRGESEQALGVADFSRAQTLAEGLRLLNPGQTFAPLKVDLRTIANRRHASILFYALGQRESYLWAITSQSVHLFVLPPGPLIDQKIRDHRKLVSGPGDALLSEDGDLFKTLIAPALPADTPNSRVVIIPDGSLNGLNFETLVVPTSPQHFFIEDATILYASSLRVLSGTQQRTSGAKRKLLLMGNSRQVGAEFKPLPHAKAEMQSVSDHFPADSKDVLSGEEANPVAYVASNPEQFAFLHFVAHGTANRLSPLDSAVILSKANASEESYKLYAREILKHPLTAELVTISSCYGSGSRTYSGEGLVGLSWAFLRAGAHHVVGALWEVSDDSTPQLMNLFYTGLVDGDPPETALRKAKLSLLRSNTVFRKPFYWGPFQLYLGS